MEKPREIAADTRAVARMRNFCSSFRNKMMAMPITGDNTIQVR